MGMTSDYTPAFDPLASDLRNWRTLGDLQKKQKVEIDYDPTGRNEDVYRISVGRTGNPIQSISRTVNRLMYHTFAGAEPVTARIESLIKKTDEDVKRVVRVVQEREDVDIRVLENTLHTLQSLNMEVALAHQGLTQLKTQYKGRVTQNKRSIPELLAEEQIALSHQVGKNISEAIEELTLRIHEKKAAMADPTTSDEKSRAAQLVDPTMSQRWASLAGDKKSPEEELRRLVQGKSEKHQGENINRLRIISGSGGQQMWMPYQFVEDIPRMRSVRLRGLGESQSVLISSSRFADNDPIQAYRALNRQLSGTDPQKWEGEDRGCIEAERVAAMMNQGFFTDLMQKVIDLSPGMNVTGGFTHYTIEIEKDKVVITMKSAFSRRDAANPENIVDNILAKRVIEVPLADLRAPDVETSKLPLPGVKITDSFSKPILNPAHANQLAEFF